MKDSRIVQLRNRAERDLAISDGALRLILRVCSFVFVDPKRKPDEAFALPWSKVAIWCGVSGENNARRRISELVEARYLKCDGARGCPPTNYFFLVLKASENGGVKTAGNGGNVTSKNSGIIPPKNGGHHISNSFQEEKIKVKREVNGSLRSAGTKGRVVAAARQITDAERAEAVEQLRKLQKELS